MIYSQVIAKLDSVNAIPDDLETSKFQRGADHWTQNILASYTLQGIKVLENIPPVRQMRDVGRTCMGVL